MTRLIAWACLIISGSLAATYGYATANNELYGLLRALGWGAVAVVGGCIPAWVSSHRRQELRARIGNRDLGAGVLFGHDLRQRRWHYRKW
jgi:hypothetical protein